MILILCDIQLNFINNCILWPGYTVLCVKLRTTRKPAAFETQQVVAPGHLRGRNTTDSKFPIELK